MAIKFRHATAVKLGHGEFINLVFKDGGSIMGQLFDGLVVTDTPKGTHTYYVRHKDDQWSDPASVKRDKDFTVNFMGTLVTETSINFGDDDELEIADWGWDELAYVSTYELAPIVSFEEAQEVADRITSLILTKKFGDKFTSTDDITTDKEMDDAWEHYNDVIFEFLRDPFKRFKRIVDVGGDWVKCGCCFDIMLVPRGADKCPNCYENDCLLWVNEGGFTMTEKQLEERGYDVCGTTYVSPTKLFTDNALAEILMSNCD